MNALLLSLLALCHAAVAQSDATTASTISSISHSSTPSPKPLALYDSARYACPMDCEQSGFNPSDWTVYHDVNRLSYCNTTILLDFTLFNPLNDPNTHTTIRTCAFAANNNATLRENLTPNATASRIDKRDSASTNTCVSLGNQEQVQQPLQIAYNGSESSSVGDFNAAAYVLFDRLATQESSCEQTIDFSYSNTAAVGLYVGSALQSQAGLATSVLQSFINSINNGGYSESNLVQLCSNQSSKFIMGIVANANADLAAVQDVVATWASGECVTTNDRSNMLDNISVTMPSLMLNSTVAFANGTAATNGTYQAAISKRGDCTTIKVASGDTCSSLASECGITPAQFTQYNNEPNECSTLTPGEHVCCTAGTLPNYAPQQYSNGTCYTYYVQPGDYCSELAASYSITVDQINSFNDNTWGWMGCNDLQAGETICLSAGAPPMPAYIQNSVCGPQVVGTPIVPAGTNLSLLSQCPLFACCDIWGQCGTTSDFCTQTKSPTGAPGTAAQGTNGCISNCGTEIITGEAPGQQFKIGYFEGFNLQRPCLNQPIQNVDFSAYTHIHLAFAGITPGFALDVSSIQQQYDGFVGLSGGFKKILSVGGWAFSTDPGTYDVFRQAVTIENQETFAANVAAFIADSGLDGIDFDWEYPGEPDIPGIPAGTLADGYNFAAFLQILKPMMPAGKTVSFTAPASFWYLQAFPLFEMTSSIDYVVYMTYDLHGQWDYGNKWSDPGCPGGNCLRSDVNLTETISALSMITKAGIPAKQIVVGVTSYGRSFQMTTNGCYTEECTYTGPSSGAYAGECTGTPGYISNAEINAILAGNATVYTPDGSPVSISGTPYTYRDNSFSNILVYNGNQWVSYMDDANKAKRAELYAAYNFLGTADWAVDLQSFNGDVGSGGSSSGPVISVDPSLWSSGNPTVQCEPPCIFALPPYPLGYASTITWPVLTTTLLSSTANSIVTVTTTISVPPFVITDISLQPVTLQPTETHTYFVNPVQSITPSAFDWTLGPNLATFPPTPIITPGQSVGGPGASGFNNNPNPGTTTTSSTTVAAVIFPGVTFHSTPFPITIQPQPTVSVTIPTPKTPAVTIATGTPKPDCTGPHCGERDCGIFGCGGGCGLFACGGGCGIFGCGGGCGPFGCSSECPLDKCGGLDCTTPGSCGGNDGDGGNNEDDCDDPQTVSACTYYVTSYTTAPSSYTTSTSTDCTTTTACDGENSSKTITPQACTATMDALLSTAMAEAGYSANGGYVPWAFAGTIPGASGLAPATEPYYGYSLSSTTANCDACTWINGSPLVCTNVAGCTQQQTKTTSTPTTTTTQTFTPPPSATADCFYYYHPGYWIFNIVGIEGWSNDGGKALHHQENGCGALTEWTWGTDDGTYAAFDIDFFIKAGCIERAIVSAGGPKLKCQRNDGDGEPLGDGGVNQRRSVNTTSSARSSSSATTSSTIFISPSGSPTYTYSTTFSTPPPYTPATWDSGSVVTLTNTYYATSTYTTTSVLTANATVPFPAATGTQTSALPTATYTVSTNGTCGSSQPGNMTCAGSSFGNCCSAYGECGNGDGYCNTKYGCQSTFSTSGSASGCYTPPPNTVSTNGTCGPSQPGNMTCSGSGYGNCCSAFGTCGSSIGYCSTSYGCQGTFSARGACYAPPYNTVTNNGTCGPSQPGNMTCVDSSFGNCCGAFGECGSTEAYCSNEYGCQGPYSSGCTDPVFTVSTNGKCGPSQPGDMTCAGSQFGDCCSAYGECGTGVDYCSNTYGCQGAFSSGCYTPPAQMISTNGTCGPSQPGNMTCVGSGFGDCCGAFGQCGSSGGYCTKQYGCQPAFSNYCLENVVSNNGTCGPSQPNNMTCADSNFGPCCSAFGTCGSTNGYCSLSYGCQIAWSSGCD